MNKVNDLDLLIQSDIHLSEAIVAEKTDRKLGKKNTI